LVSLSPCPGCPFDPVVIQWLHSEVIEDRIERQRIANVNNKTLSTVKNDLTKASPSSSSYEWISPFASPLSWSSPREVEPCDEYPCLVLNCLQSLGIPQDNKELFSRVLSSSKEPILVPKLGVPNYFEDVKLPPDLPPILGNLEKGGVPSVLQLEVKFLVKLVKGEL